MKVKSLLGALLVVAPLVVRAQAPDTLSLLGRNALTVGIGFTKTSSTTATNTGASTHASGQIGSLEYSHWLLSSVAFQASVSLLGEDATTSPGHVHNNTLTPILVGFSLSPKSFALSRSLRPYLSVAGGPFIHTVSDVSGGTTSNTTESSLGARFGAGANWFVLRHLVLGLDANYHAVKAFDHPDALTADPSGFGMSALIGVTWGGRR
jgi:hypothetical protein